MHYEIVRILLPYFPLCHVMCLFACAGVPLTPSNVVGLVREVRRWWGGYGSRSLAYWLSIPESKQDEIRRVFSDEMDQKKQSISYWINTDPLASWRRLITALDMMVETELADSIRSNAEPLTGTWIQVHAYACILCNHMQWNPFISPDFMYIHG